MAVRRVQDGTTDLQQTLPVPTRCRWEMLLLVGDLVAIRKAPLSLWERGGVRGSW